MKNNNTSHSQIKRNVQLPSLKPLYVSEEEWEICRYFVHGGHSPSEIAKRMGSNQGHVYAVLARCLKLIASADDTLNDEGAAIGDWNGSVFGKFGELERDGDFVRCHCCGRWMKQLSGHLKPAHNLTARQYKIIFGLNLGTALAGDSVRESASQSAWKRYQETDFAKRGQEVQAAGNIPRQSYRSIESRNKQSATVGGEMATTCVVCNREIRGYWTGRTKICSTECHATYLRQLVRERIASGEHPYLWIKLTVDDAVEIIEKLASGNYSRQELADRYGVSRADIHLIAAGKIWSWVTDSEIPAA